MELDVKIFIIAIALGFIKCIRFFLLVIQVGLQMKTCVL